MGTGAKGTISNPYTMAEFEELADAGLWQGGFVIDDGGNVAYMMVELTVTGYSGYSGDGSDGSDYDPWGSDPWGSDPWGSDPNGSDDYPWNGDDGTGGTGGTGGTPGGGTSGGGGGGHHGGGTNTNNIGTFNSGMPFYTRTQFDTKKANGTWLGGNVFSLGYVNSSGYIHPSITQLGEVSESWINTIGNVANSVLDNIRRGCQAIISSPYVQAISRYYSASGEPLHLDVNTLGLNNMPDNLLKHESDNIYTINLFSEKILSVLSGHTLEEQAQIISTAITLGKITLNKIGDRQYVIQSDTYDFDIPDWTNPTKRDIATAIGYIVSEGICINIDAFIGEAIGGYTGRAYMISAGLLNRHVIGTTTFKIYIDGTLNTR